MADIFFSYRSVDRDRVRPVRDALAAHGFDVFWDQAVPSGVDWDTWIRQHLANAKCTLVFWSLASVASDNVRHEATVAKMQGKLIQVLLDPLTPDQFPMGLYSQQGVNLSAWAGNVDHEEWRKAISEIESKLTPAWVQRQLYEMDATLTAERAHREGAENRVRALQTQIGKEVAAQENLRRARDQAADEAATLRSTVDRLNQALSEAASNGPDQSQHEALKARIAKQESARKKLKEERDQLADQTAALTVRVDELNAALKEARVKQAAVDRQSPVRPLVAPVNAADTSSRTSPLGGKLQLAALGIAVGIIGLMALAAFWPKSATPSPPPVAQTTPSSTGAFNVTGGTEAYDDLRLAVSSSAYSVAECEQGCLRSASCKVYTYSKTSKLCWQLPATAKFRPNATFDTGVRR